MAYRFTPLFFMYVVKSFRCWAYAAYELALRRFALVWVPWVKVSIMLAGGFHGVAKTVAPSATARVAVARSRLQSDWFSPTGILSTENPSLPSPLPNAVSRWAAVRSPIQAAWAMAPKPRIV